MVIDPITSRRHAIASRSNSFLCATFRGGETLPIFLVERLRLTLDGQTLSQNPAHVLEYLRAVFYLNRAAILAGEFYRIPLRKLSAPARLQQENRRRIRTGFRSLG